jgi:hypothetical protein
VQKLALSLVSGLALLATPGAGHAAERRIAVLRADAELNRAIALSLSPWGVDTLNSDAALPESSLPQALWQAVKLAGQLRVDAVVWVSTSQDGSVLWVYDTRTDKITTRALEDAPPFESSRAAAIALSVKTVLRASVVAPPAERFGASPSPPPPPRKAERLALETGVDARLLAAGKVEPRLSLGGVLWLTRGPWLGIGLAFSEGPGVRVHTPSYRGTYSERSLGSSLQARWLDGPRLRVATLLGVSALAAVLEGNLSQDASHSEVRRWNWSLDAGTRLDVKLGGGAYVGVGVQASYLAAYQRYLVRGAPVFSVWPVAFAMGGHCGVDVF